MLIFSDKQIEDNRGNAIRTMLKTLQLLCSSDLESLGNAILPIVTKVKPSKKKDVDEEWDDDDLLDLVIKKVNIRDNLNK